MRTIIKSYENGYGNPTNWIEIPVSEPRIKYKFEEELSVEAMKIPPIIRIYMDINTTEQYKELKKDASRLLTDIKLC